MDDLDFWIGDWNATWDGGNGSNTVSRELGGGVVVERFEVAGDEPFAGISLSIFDAFSKCWRQTWVDSQGNYWTFIGHVQSDGSLIFATPDRVDAENVFKRMLFYNITSEAFDWRWESSPSGHDWKQQWAIRYVRR